MADKDRLRRQNARLKGEIEAMRPVVDAVQSLIHSGYDGPFMGPAVEPLLRAFRKYAKPKVECKGPSCTYPNVCNAVGRCCYAPESNSPMTNE